MTPIRIFISSVQNASSRGSGSGCGTICAANPLMRRFFEVFLFEDVPASDRRPDEVYLGEVDRCDIYVGLFGNEYGFEDARGLSPTEREFDRATELAKHRLIFVMGADDGKRHPRMLDLIARAAGRPGKEAVRHRGRVGRRALRRARAVSGSEGAAALRAVRRRPVLRSHNSTIWMWRACTASSASRAGPGSSRCRRENRAARPAQAPEPVEQGTADQSVPRNPLLAESMYLMRYIEKMGTGTLDMIRRCAKAGLPEPEFEGRRRLRGDDLARWRYYPGTSRHYRGRIWYYPDHYRNR